MATSEADRRALIAIVGSAVLLIVVVLAIVFVAIVPLPDFEELPPGVADGRVAFMTDADCVAVADLSAASVRDIVCDLRFPEVIAWDEGALVVEVFDSPGGATRSTYDALTGAELSIEFVDSADGLPPRPVESPPVRGPRGMPSIVGDDGATLLTLDGPETYWIDSVASNDPYVAFVDSQGRLAMVEIGSETVYLIAGDVRNFPAPVWEP